MVFVLSQYNFKCFLSFSGSKTIQPNTKRNSPFLIFNGVFFFFAIAFKTLFKFISNIASKFVIGNWSGWKWTQRANRSHINSCWISETKWSGCVFIQFTFFISWMMDFCVLCTTRWTYLLPGIFNSFSVKENQISSISVLTLPVRISMCQELKYCSL